MPKAGFDWEPRKAASNQRKHGVSFEEAAEVFDDPLALYVADLDHAEIRLVIIGSSSRGRLLYVVSVELEGDEIRIVSARRATRNERLRYEEGD